MTSRPATRADPAVADDDWGRVPGLRPPLPVGAPLAWFVALAVILTAVVVVLVRPPGLLDQPDPAYQRDGLLLDGALVPEQVAGVDFGSRPVLLLFDRGLPEASALEQWLAAVPERAVVRLVVPEPVPRVVTHPRLEIVVDPDGQLADAVDLPAPVGGGRGIGYAVVDSDRQVQYSTLDPVYLGNAFEVATIVGSVP